MISRLRGEILRKESETVEVLTQGGVGYEVSVPTSTWGELPRIGDLVDLRILQVVREDSITLYGFASDREREVFRRLLAASGVGPRTALSILSTLGCVGLVRAVQEKDAKSLTSVPGIGKKSAEKLVLELAGRFDDVPATAAGSSGRTDISVAVEALIALGYPRDVSSRAVHSTLEEDPTLDGPSLVRASIAAAQG